MKHLITLKDAGTKYIPKDKPFVDCPLCDGRKTLFDEKKVCVRPCLVCKGTGKVKNWNL
jgi:hypothetical protein